MPSLETLIHQWKESIRNNLDGDAMEEIEQHLREAIAREIGVGKSHEEAFRAAVKELGDVREISAEFDKVGAMDWWAVKATMAAGAILFVLACFFSYRLSDRQFGWLLAPHVFSVTVGFSGTYLAGALGIAYAAQRLFSDFSDGRLQIAARAATTFSGGAAILTGVGIVLAMFWAKLAWGRYWAWDLKETGALGILVWQILFYLAGRSGLMPPRAILLLAIFGNVVVSVGWFGANRSFNLLIALAAAHLIFLLAGALSNVGPNGRAPSQV